MANVPLLMLLPEVFQLCAPNNAPLRALSAVAADMHAPVQEVLDSMDRLVDPFRAPENMLGHLSRWVDLDWLTLPEPESAPGAALGIPSARLRGLIANAADLSARRGTPGGMLRFLQLATGLDGFEIDVDPAEFHLRVRVPANASGQIGTVRRIVAGWKPAHITAELLILPDGPAEPPVPEGPGEGPETIPARPTTPPRSSPAGQVDAHG